MKRGLALFTALVMLFSVSSLSVPIKTEAKSVDDYKVVWSNTNGNVVGKNPTGTTKFTVSSGKKLKLNAITLYHYNGGKGVKPGKITLKKKGGSKIGTWKASGRYNNQWWDVFPNKTLSAGTYIITCTSKKTWSCNSTSKNAGFAEIFGVYSSKSSSASSSGIGKPQTVRITYWGKTDYYSMYRIKYKKVSGANGYVIQVAKDKKFKNILKTEENYSLSYPYARSLSKEDNVKLYVRVRAFKKSGSKKTYGSWSSVKSFIYSHDG